MPLQDGWFLTSFGVFSSGFSHRITSMSIQNRFWHVLVNVNLWPKLSTMADFQHRLISGIFSVFSSGFLYRITPMWIQNWFWHVLENLNFWPKLSILQRLYSPCKGYSLWKMADFQHRLISGIIGVFSSGFWQRITPMWIQNRFWHVLRNLNFWAKLSVSAKAMSHVKAI